MHTNKTIAKNLASIAVTFEDMRKFVGPNVEDAMRFIALGEKTLAQAMENNRGMHQGSPATIEAAEQLVTISKAADRHRILSFAGMLVARDPVAYRDEPAGAIFLARDIIEHGRFVLFALTPAQPSQSADDPI